MPDYDKMLAMLDRAGIVYSTDWNREVLVGDETAIVKWISVMDGRHNSIDFKFGLSGNLMLISSLTDEI